MADIAAKEAHENSAEQRVLRSVDVMACGTQTRAYTEADPEP